MSVALRRTNPFAAFLDGELVCTVIYLSSASGGPTSRKSGSCSSANSANAAASDAGRAGELESGGAAHPHLVPTARSSSYNLPVRPKNAGFTLY
jgi:hypothetical protein